MFPKDNDLAQRVHETAEAHLELANVYEKAGNATGATVLRHVGNLLHALHQGHKGETIYPGAPPKYKKLWRAEEEGTMTVNTLAMHLNKQKDLPVVIDGLGKEVKIVELGVGFNEGNESFVIQTEEGKEL